MKIKNTIILLAMMLPLCGMAMTEKEAQKLFTEANNEYDSGNYESAVAKYNSIFEQGYTSWQLFYNLGNTYYRLDDIGHSILNYERALRLSPTNKTIRDNLKLAQSKASDHIEEVPMLFLKEWFLAIVNLASAKGWKTICIILTLLTSIAAFLFFTTKNYSTRKWTFVIGICLLVLLIFSAINATFSTLYVTNCKEAVIVDPVVVVKGSPDAKSVDKFMLHDGTKVTVNDSQDEWWQIEIADGKSGWINSGAEKI